MTISSEFSLVSVVLPAYRLGESIAPNMVAVAEALPGAQIVVVDDGSDDDTYGNALQAAAGIKRALVIRHERNRGKGAALQTGTAAAKGSTVVFLDGDLDLPPAQLPGLLSFFADRDADVLVGAKQERMSDGRYPWKRRTLSRLFSLVARVLFRLPVDETQTGLKIFRRAVLEEVFADVQITGYAFDLELLVRANRAGFRIIQAPVDLRVGASSQPLRLSTLWEMGRDTLRIWLWSARRRVK
jgi:glycosyltransferase involved in cell wall biosynthesis